MTEKVNIKIVKKIKEHSHFNNYKNDYVFSENDKYIYIIFDRIPNLDLGIIFLKDDEYITFLLEKTSIEQGKKAFQIPCCAYPLFDLFNNSLQQIEWQVAIFDIITENIIFESTILCKIHSNYNQKKSIYHDTFKGSYIDIKY
ncbi:hypothetical protein [Caloranaerobacter azorensis]|uniref:Uncharacterized protein n=1 Tax=Caloranaerobacter azorensis TaxID=116090 RepID=A0A6P1YH33_9FIRM|nr:hypothetical protein [Caloranaerobacter azorensis]QIB27216.1 hypothetical protein G3A45_07920 [Caloranaerobacter azorensis]